jgi:hypothetical protein
MIAEDTQRSLDQYLYNIHVSFDGKTMTKLFGRSHGFSMKGKLEGTPLAVLSLSAHRAAKNGQVQDAIKNVETICSSVVEEYERLWTNDSTGGCENSIRVEHENNQEIKTLKSKIASKKEQRKDIVDHMDSDSPADMVNRGMAIMGTSVDETSEPDKTIEDLEARIKSLEKITHEALHRRSECARVDVINSALQRYILEVATMTRSKKLIDVAIKSVDTMSLLSTGNKLKEIIQNRAVEPVFW